MKIIFSINKINIFTNLNFKFQTSLQPFQMYKPGADEEKAENARLVTLNYYINFEIFFNKNK